MIVYGSKAVYILSKKSTTRACPSCGTNKVIKLIIYSRHVHIFWIPLFPIGKKGISQCGHCKNVLYRDEMPALIRKEYDILKHKAKGPIWQFSGLAISLIVILWVMISNF